jgi:hypothetical protein
MAKNLVSVRIISNAIFEKPGITPKDLSERIEFPLPATVRTLALLQRNNHIGRATPPASSFVATTPSPR